MTKMEIDLNDAQIEKIEILKSNGFTVGGAIDLLFNVQKEIKAGGSGPVCSALVVYSYLYDLLKKKKLKRVLFLATGALFSPLLLYQKENINSICHAISLEVV